MQRALFPEHHGERTAVAVPGFRVLRAYVSADDERALIAAIDEGPWESDWKRRIQQFGVGYAGDIGAKPSWVRDFPPWLAALAQRITDDRLIERFPENAVVNEYAPGIGIGPHRDYRTFGPTVIGVSLGDDVVMDLRDRERDLHVPIALPARSLYVLGGEARAHWLHGIAPRLTDVVDGVRRKRARRLSISFRTAVGAARAVVPDPSSRRDLG